MVARGRFELPSGGPEPPMIDRYTTGLNPMLCYRKVLFSLINLSSPISGTEIDEKRGFLYVFVHLILSTGRQIVIFIY
jgi:hypothetical protein